VVFLDLLLIAPCEVLPWPTQWVPPVVTSKPFYQ